jgi:gamma-glutamyltranspeptidase/glutathione hydrolase
MVSSAHPLATDAGVAILELGGNAADAAVAAGFAVAVVEPTMNSIAGRNQILIRTPDGEFHGIDGTTQAPWDYDYDTAPQASYGYPVIGVPGALAGLLKLHEEHGSLPLSTLMASAIDLAQNGFRVLPQDAIRQASGLAQAREFPGTIEAYYRGGENGYRAGELLVQADYAKTLSLIASEGREVFYEGEIAEKMAADLAANGSAVTLKAFNDYVAEDSRIVRGSYRGYELVGMGIPAAGVLSIQALQVMEEFEPSSMSEAEWFAVTGQALNLASRELRVLGTDTAAARATSKDWAAQLARQVASPNSSVPTADNNPLPTLEDRGDLFGGHTTHLSTADANGMFVSLTQTLGPNMGSKVVTPGLGFLYASTLGGYLGQMEPGERARSNICPFIVLKDGEVILVLGAAGGGMIPPAVVHTITRVIDFGMSLPQALAEPRVVAARGGGYSAETSPGIGWTAPELEEMRNLGIEVTETARTGAFGRVHGIQFDPATRTWIGAADPDWEGTARGPAMVRTRGR